MTVFDLWLPIVLSGLATHVLSSISWMVMPHHKPEWIKMPAEDEVQGLIEAKGIPAGQYMFPFASSPEEMQSPEFKRKQGQCKGMLVLWQTPLNMGVAIAKTFSFFMIAAFVIGYLASLALPAGESFSPVIQFVTTAGLLAHCSAHFPHVFWFRRRIAMELVDGVVYAFVTGLLFALLWPAA
ncbi:hypothetical protein Pla22_20040 [Rubripirellula amarantea]|uniref:Uncharacterized protein n=1 Tax=Rubripirellula amarantea TaxID=2527999 RepID=A0A5C5WUF2_9BACT|nr:hypothetical protein [Rubripirellula amarantea]TWT54357.1 hypothetical protein Pla22_20040 [Rubripirellula amarantea]